MTVQNVEEWSSQHEENNHSPTFLPQIRLCFKMNIKM